MPKATVLAACIIFISVEAAANATDSFYVNPGSPAAQWVKQNSESPLSTKIQTSIASVPSARWLTGTSQATDKLTDIISQYVGAADKAHKPPILVAYNLPGRDCSGGASAGGAANAVEYRDWIDRFINGIGDKPALVILEPDALADSECLTLPKRNYNLDPSRSYGDAINAKLSADYGYAKAMVIDTSRNGNGATPGDWCNPPGLNT